MNNPTNETEAAIRRQFKAATNARDEAYALARMIDQHVAAIRQKLIETQLGGRVDQIVQLPPIDLGKAVSAYADQIVRVAIGPLIADDPVAMFYGILSVEDGGAAYSVNWEAGIRARSYAGSIRFAPRNVGHVSVDVFGIPTIALK